MISTFKLIRVRIQLNDTETRVEYINSAHVLRFYEVDNTIIMELTNGVKLNVIGINLDLLCEDIFR